MLAEAGRSWLMLAEAQGNSLKELAKFLHSKVD
jgi:hypothetical protein